MSDEQKKSTSAVATADKEEKTEEVKEETKHESADEQDKQDQPKEKPNADVPSKFKKLVEEIEKMPLSDVAELVKALEERWGVVAQAAAPAATGAGASPAAAAEEKSSYTVMLVDGGAQKIAAIKAVRELRQDLGLKEAKDLVDGAPKEVLKDVKKVEAEAAKTKLEAAGAKVELK